MFHQRKRRQYAATHLHPRGPGGRVSGLRRGAHAQAKPSSIRLVVPYPAGGAADQIARLVANDAGAILGTPIVIENKGGAGGMIAAESVLQAAPDGATFFVGSNAPIVINQAIYEKMSYDPAKDFVPSPAWARRRSCW